MVDPIRRRLLATSGAAALGMVMPWPRLLAADLPAVPPRAQWTPLRAIAGYNNYYEFSTEKEAVRVLAQRLTTSPWHIEIGGLVEKPLTLDLDDLRAQHPEERVYSLRCIEAWSKLVPWQGVPLHRILSLVKPLSAARYVRFTGTYRPSEMINQRRPVLDWPYTEALRIDEAEHPLTLLATGLYGQDLPPANGAPVRLVVPWKYGFKSIKAIQRIDLVAEQPLTTWMKEAPGDFDFYANVNPNLAHPRWNQQRETRLGEPGKRATEMYNGYGEQVAHLYKGR